MAGNNKKNKQTKQLIKPNGIEPVLLQSEIATHVIIQVPQKIIQAEKNINKTLISQYLQNKILNKRVKKGMKFTAIYLGLQQNFQIIDVRGQAEIKEEKVLQNQKQQLMFVVKQKTVVQLDFKKKQTINLFIENQQNSQKVYGHLSQIKDLKSTILSSLKDRQIYIKNGLGPLKGVLVTGFTGTGKSTLVKSVLKQVYKQLPNLHTKTISSINLLSKVVGGAQQFISRTFSQLKNLIPSILVIQDLHLLFSIKQINSHTTTLAALLSQLSNLSHQKLILIGTSNIQYDLVPQIKGSGKFQKQISLNLPNHHERLQILKGFLESIQDQDSDSEQIDIEDLKSLNLRMNGFSIGQIKQIIREAYSKNNNQISKKSIEDILKAFKPSEIKQLIVEVPQVYWKDIGGYDNVKSEIKKVTQLPLKHPEAFKKFGIDPIKGIMLYGPPGCSKTMMAKAIATESKLNFIGVKGPQLFSKYVGDSQKAVRNIFKRARACSPCIIFFDQIDALASKRSSNTQVSDRVLCQLLNEMDGIQGLKQVIIIAATNRPQILDAALMRPGRFDYLIYVSPPDLAARKEIFKIYLSKSQNKDRIEELSTQLAEKTQGYTGAQISLVCREGALMALQQNINCQNVQLSHYQIALKKIRKRLSTETIWKYTNFQANLKY